MNFLDAMRSAMHEAIMSLKEPHRTIFMNVLADMVHWHGDELSLEGYAAHTPELFGFSNATAAHRAEAFLRTIGKWEDDK